MIPKKREDVDKRDILYSTLFKINRTSDRVILDTREILDQGKFGTCVAFAIAGAVNKLFRDILSPLYNYKHTKDIDTFVDQEGTTLDFGLKALLKDGTVPEELYPYEQYKTPLVFPKISEELKKVAEDYKIDAYVKITTPKELIDNLLHGNGAVAGMTVGLDSLFNPEYLENGDAVLDMPLGRVAGHAVYLCGVDVKMQHTYKDGTTRTGFAKFANSWGTGKSRREFGTEDEIIWSETGYGWIPFDYLFGEMEFVQGYPTPYVNQIFVPLKNIPFSIMKIDNISDDTKPYINNSRTMLPLRFVGEILGAQVEYNEFDRGIDITKPGLSVKLRIDEDEMVVNNNRIYIDTPPEIKNNRTFVPIRAVAEAFDCEVTWFDNERKVEIQKDNKVVEMWIDHNEARVITRTT